MQRILLFSLSILSLLLTSCESPQAIVNQIDEREANEIIVFLASKGIDASKIAAEATGAGTGPSNMWNIMVPPSRMTEAMALLNQNGLPRKKGESLLSLFSASGMMTSDREENIRYQAGIAQELQNMIRKMDGVLDVDVQLAFPTTEATVLPGATREKVTASVYVKHQGVFDDPNNYLEMKIKRLVAGSVSDLAYDDVTVVADRSRLTDISISPSGQIIAARPAGEGSVRIWSIQMDKSSVGKFRFIFFTMIIIILAFAGLTGYSFYRFYPQMQKASKKKQEKEPKE